MAEPTFAFSMAEPGNAFSMAEPVRGGRETHANHRSCRHYRHSERKKQANKQGASSSS